MRLRSVPSAIKTPLFLLALLVITFLAFLPSLKNGFLEWDDTVYLTKNPVILRLDGENIPALLTAKVEQIYVPLVLLSFSLEHHFFGFNPFVYHFDNLLLHIGLVFLIFALANRFGLSLWASFFGALLFALHPLHAESVAWVSERKDLLYSFFYVCALLAYAGYCRRPAAGRFALTVVFGFLSVLAKPMALSLPFILFLCDWFWQRGLNRKTVLEKIPHFLYMVPIVWITYSMNARNPIQHLAQAPLFWVWSFMFYVHKFILPYPLLALYDTPRPVALWNLPYGLSVILLLLVVYSLWRFRWNRWWLFAWGYYFLSIFFLLRLDTRVDLVMVADHYMYLPSLGFCLFLGQAAAAIVLKTREHRGTFFSYGIGILVGVFLTMAVATFQQAKIWGDEYAMWMKVLKFYPSAIAHDNLGLYYTNRGQYDRAIDEHTQALAINPHDVVRTFNNRGLAYMHKGEFENAVADYSRTIQLDPAYKITYFNRGLAYERLGNRDAALADYTKDLELNPLHVDAFYARGLLYYHQGKRELALRDLTRALTINPRYVSGYFIRGQIYARSKMFEAALADFNTVLRLNPGHAKALNQRGLVHQALGDHDSAIRDFAQAVRIDPQYGLAQENRQRLNK